MQSQETHDIPAVVLPFAAPGAPPTIARFEQPNSSLGRC
jgi:hypothetical protein